MVQAEIKSGVEVFATKLKWIALAYDDHARICRLSLYNDTRQSAITVIQKYLTSGISVQDGNSELARKLMRYAQGHETSFSEVELAPCSTAFQEKVRNACREIGYGKIATYGQLAHRAKSPKAARAVGLCMRNNPVPIIVPCHRIVGSTGRLRGFSLGPGVSLKQQMLSLEGVNREFVR